MSIPWTALALGTVGGAAAVRALWRPARAVIADGYALRCAGADCDPAMIIESFSGQAPVYAVAPGRILSAGPTWVHVALASEPVILGYDAEPGGAFVSEVKAGMDVGTGQQIARAARLRFGVFVVWREAGGAIKLIPNEPAAWLAARGLSISQKSRPRGGAWCEQGRRIIVPETVGKCGIRLPSPGAFALLPVSVTMG